MKLKIKRQLDDVLGTPLLVLVNFGARILGFFLGRSHAVDPVNSILIMKFQGMGSLVLAKPALAQLRSCFPNARIVFWGTPSVLLLARKMPEFDEYLELDDQSFFSLLTSFLKTIFLILRMKIDWCLDLEPYSKFSAVFSTLTAARNRAGFVVNVAKNRTGAYTHLLFFNRYEYLGAAYEQLVGLVTQKRSRVTDANQWRFSLDANTFGLPSRYIVINPHAGDLALEKKWPIESYAQLARHLVQRMPIVYLGFGKKEIEETLKLPQGKDIINLAGRLDLEKTVQVLNSAELVVSNDTAALHFALLGKAAVVGVFGPTKAKTYFPKFRQKAIASSIDIYCSPCVHHWDPPPCGGDNLCLKELSVDRVLKDCVKVLESRLDLESDERPVIAGAYYPGLIHTR